MDRPEVRQCIDPEHEDFGSTAVKIPGQNFWAVMHVGKGGEWAVDAERVKNWATGTFPEFVPPPAEEVPPTPQPEVSV